MVAPRDVTAKSLVTVGKGDKGTSKWLGNLTLFQMVEETFLVWES